MGNREGTSRSAPSLFVSFSAYLLGGGLHRGQRPICGVLGWNLAGQAGEVRVQEAVIPLRHASAQRTGGVSASSTGWTTSETGGAFCVSSLLDWAGVA